METSNNKFEIIHETINKSDNRLSVKMLCEIAGVSRSGYYNWVSSERKRKEKQSKAIAKINGEKLPAEEVSFAASAKGKIVIVAYVVALLTVLFFLATSLNSISMLKTDILTLNAAIAAETENVRELTNVANTDNREELIAAAEELGYTNEGNSEVRNIVLADILPEEETYESTNWFDKLCDWLIGD